MTTLSGKKIVIVGGGFAGVRAALDLAKSRERGIKIVLISDLPHFEYHAALYRVVAGHSPLQVCVPLADIFAGLPVEIIRDRINRVDLPGKLLTGSSGSRYTFDYLVLALGSENNYFGISGLPQFSFGIKSISEALRLKNHLHQMFEIAAKNQEPVDKVTASHIVIVGGGATGVELAGELANYTQELAREHKLDPSLVTIDLIEGASRLMPMLPAPVSEALRCRLHNLGVNIFLNRVLMKEEITGVATKDMSFQAQTVVWTAGVKNNTLLAGIPGFTFDKKGRVLADEHLRASPGVYVVGDSVAVPNPGLASTAVATGAHAARSILADLRGLKLAAYGVRSPWTSVPVGAGWAATIIGPLRLYGRVGWWLRRYIDYRYFRSILPFSQAWRAFDPMQKNTESCPVCCNDGQIEFK